MSMKNASPAGQLQLDDLLYRKRVARRRLEKTLGRIPKGYESAFGDFPTDDAAKSQHSVMFFGTSSPRSQSKLSSNYRGGRAAEDRFCQDQLSPRSPRKGACPTAEEIRSAAHAGDEVLPSPRAPASGTGIPLLPPCVAKADQDAHVSPRASFQRRREGQGGRNYSTQRPKELPQVVPQILSARDQPQIIKSSDFRRAYDRSDLPIQVLHLGNKNKVRWKTNIDQLDYNIYLPIFIDGIREKEDPYRFLAIEGTYDLLESGSHKVLPVVPKLIMPLKLALNTRDSEIVSTTLKVIQKLILCNELIGESLMPYYRQLLPGLNVFKSRVHSTYDQIDYGQRKRRDLGSLLEETLEMLEATGGEDAFVNIKYSIPTYESAVLE